MFFLSTAAWIIFDITFFLNIHVRIYLFILFFLNILTLVIFCK